MQSLLKINKHALLPCHESLSAMLTAKLHLNSPSYSWRNVNEPKRFLNYNKKIYPPQMEAEERRPAFVCHQKTNIRYSPKKMWYVAAFVRGMAVDEAIKQLSFVLKKGAAAVKETILEAQELAVTKHNVEFKSNLWVAESLCSKGMMIKGLRRHARGRMGEIRYIYTHYFVRLEEGPPPKNFNKETLLTPQEQLDSWLEGMRKRKVIGSI